MTGRQPAHVFCRMVLLAWFQKLSLYTGIVVVPGRKERKSWLGLRHRRGLQIR